MMIFYGKFELPSDIVEVLNKWHREGWVIKHLQIVCRPSFTGDEWHVFVVLDKPVAT